MLNSIYNGCWQWGHHWILGKNVFPVSGSAIVFSVNYKRLTEMQELQLLLPKKTNGYENNALENDKETKELYTKTTQLS